MWIVPSEFKPVTCERVKENKMGQRKMVLGSYIAESLQP